MTVTAEHLHEELFSWLDTTIELARPSTRVERHINTNVIDYLTSRLGDIARFYEDVSTDSGVLFAENLHDAEYDVTNLLVKMGNDPGRFYGDYDDSNDTGVDYIHDNYDDMILVVGHRIVDDKSYTPAKIINTYWATVAEKVIDHYHYHLPTLSHNILNLGDV